MATVATEPLTAEQFFEWANRRENIGKSFELENGEVIEMPSPGELHGARGRILARRGAGGARPAGAAAECGVPDGADQARSLNQRRTQCGVRILF